MPCIFCGQHRKMSGEHLWPEWAKKSLPEGAQKKILPHSIELHDREPTEWTAPIFSSTLKEVCEVCNTGWMSDIEKWAQPIAEPLIQGQTQSLDSEAHGILAIWAYLKILLFERVDKRQRMLPERRYHEFHSYASNGEFGLPGTALAFTASHEGALDGQYAHRGLARPRLFRKPKLDLFVGTLTVRKLVLQISENLIGRPGEAPPRHKDLPSRERQIWPPGPTFTWPVGPPLSDEELWMFAGPIPENGHQALRRALELTEQ